ncbi:hypothetical protein BT93_D0687 [Corymbia citriodora subsp. variegata]|nr:hypothetical protein BT93_D0687 [Corymbia citriodora subsp. variegata]
MEMAILKLWFDRKFAKRTFFHRSSRSPTRILHFPLKKQKDPRLRQAIEHDDVDELHGFIVEEPNLLDRESKGPFQILNTPLHVTAAAGKTQVAMELAILEPSFTWKLDWEGYTPMHLALQHQHYHTVRTLMTLDSELIRVQGWCGFTPLHYVAGKEGEYELELLAEFLFTCRLSIEDLTSRMKGPLSLGKAPPDLVRGALAKAHPPPGEARKGHPRLGEIQQGLASLDLTRGALIEVGPTGLVSGRRRRLGPSEGNPPSHVPPWPMIIKLLIGHTNVNAKNFLNRTALDNFQVNAPFDEDVARRLRSISTSTLSLSQFFSRELSFFEKYLHYFGIQDEATRNIILVVATLIATATYQAVLTPPGGYWPDSSSNPPANSSVATANSSGIAAEKPHQAGNIILSGSDLFSYAYLNSTAFFVSVASIVVAALSLLPRTFFVYYSLIFPSTACYGFLLIDFPKSDRFVGSIVGDCFWFLPWARLILPLLM